MRVEITQSDIDGGWGWGWFLRRDPMESAIRRALPGRRIKVYRETVHIDDVSHMLPPEATAWIVRYDRHAKIEPFAFDLPILAAVVA